MSTYSALVMASSPRAYYRLSELIGSTAFDQTANAYNGTYHGGYTLQQDNAIVPEYTDYAVLLDGKTGWISLPSGLSVAGLSTLTVEVWLNLTTTSFPQVLLVLANDNNVTGSHVGFFLELSMAGSAQSGIFTLGNGTIGVSKSFGSGVLASNTWYHLVGVYDGTQLLMYVNGIPDQGNNPAISGTVGTATHNIAIGANVTGTGNLFPGVLDEVAIYPSALSASTITNHYNTGTIGRTGITPFPPAVRRAGTITVTRRQS